MACSFGRHSADFLVGHSNRQVNKPIDEFFEALRCLLFLSSVAVNDSLRELAEKHPEFGNLKVPCRDAARFLESQLHHRASSNEPAHRPSIQTRLLTS